MEYKKIENWIPSKETQFTLTAKSFLDSFMFGNQFDLGLRVEYPSSKFASGNIEVLCIRNYCNDTTNLNRTEEYYCRWDAEEDFESIADYAFASEALNLGQLPPTIYTANIFTDNSRYASILSEIRVKSSKFFWRFKNDDIFTPIRYTMNFGDSWNNNTFHWIGKLPEELEPLQNAFRLMTKDLEKFK